jgi:glycerol-3-phosphate dehydrogenase
MPFGGPACAFQDGADLLKILRVHRCKRGGGLGLTSQVDLIDSIDIDNATRLVPNTAGPWERHVFG